MFITGEALAGEAGYRAAMVSPWSGCLGRQ
jgi:hypothetical protein